MCGSMFLCPLCLNQLVIMKMQNHFTIHVMPLNHLDILMNVVSPLGLLSKGRKHTTLLFILLSSVVPKGTS